MSSGVPGWLPCAAVTDVPQEPPEPAPQIIIQPEQMAGVWANYARVSHSPYEFTLDFVRLDWAAGVPPPGIVVARVSLSPRFVTELIDALNANWTTYARNALPQEVYDDGAEEEPPSGPEA